MKIISKNLTPMAYDEFLADRIRTQLKEKNVLFVEKKMMGGLCFMMDNKMLCGIIKNDLMARVGKENYNESLSIEGCNEMKFTGRPLKGFVLVDSEAIDLEDDLSFWIKKCIDYNPFAKASKKKK